ncbi:MAG: hypothetical protein GXP43_00325 [bacterium]|nr:hypothetical protein [bacterium]
MISTTEQVQSQISTIFDPLNKHVENLCQQHRTPQPLDAHIQLVPEDPRTVQLIWKTVIQFVTGNIILDSITDHKQRRKFRDLLAKTDPDLSRAYENNIARINNITDMLLFTTTTFPRITKTRVPDKKDITPNVEDIFKKIKTAVIKIQQQPDHLDEFNQVIQEITQITNFSSEEIITLANLLNDLIYDIGSRRLRAKGSHGEDIILVSDYDKLEPLNKYLIARTVWHLATAVYLRLADAGIITVKSPQD